jgi:hypothetical protein
MQPARIALVSCVKKKTTGAVRASELYTSNLFRQMRCYAESHSDAWFILSAKFGLLEPQRIIEPYEQTLLTMTAADRRRWWDQVRPQLLKTLPPRACVIILAGRRYRAQMEPFLISRGYRVEVPLRGLGIGKQLQWLKRANG